MMRREKKSRENDQAGTEKNGSARHPSDIYNSFSREPLYNRQPGKSKKQY
jgi:hypothetical protein